MWPYPVWLSRAELLPDGEDCLGWCERRNQTSWSASGGVISDNCQVNSAVLKPFTGSVPLRFMGQEMFFLVCYRWASVALCCRMNDSGRVVVGSHHISSVITSSDGRASSSGRLYYSELVCDLWNPGICSPDKNTNSSWWVHIETVSAYNNQ